MLRIRDLSMSYRGPRGHRLVLRDVNFELHRGEYVAIMGESGAGKSTLLNLIAGLDTPNKGAITFDGADITALSDDARTLLRRDRMGFVFQAFHLLPHLTVAQNIALPLALAGATQADCSPRTRELLEAVGIATLGETYPRELSGGELQRVAIARALVHRPQLILADEPTGNLDSETAAQVLALLHAQIKRHGGAGILVTHSPTAAATADRVYVLSASGLKPDHP